MGTTVRASQLSSAISKEKAPSVFDILAQENLSSSIRPALQHLVKFLAIFKPKHFLSIHRNFDECFLLFDAALQSYFLKRYGASFSENFYSMKRVSTVTGKPPNDGREFLMSLITIVGWPYIENKLNDLHKKLKETYELRTWISLKGAKETLKKAFVICWPYIKLVLSGIKTILQLSYILNKSSIHSPWLYFSSVVLQHLSPSDLEQFNSIPMHHRTGALNRIWRGFLSLPGLFSRLFAYGMFFVQFLDHIYNTDIGSMSFNPLNTKVPAAPHKMLLRESEILSLDTNKCPICMKKRVNDTTLYVSGYIFCYECIYKYVSTHKKCPVTNLPANTTHLIRIFV